MEYFETASGRLIYGVYGTKRRTNITRKDLQAAKMYKTLILKGRL